MEEEQLITIVASHEERMTKLEYDLQEHYVTKWENNRVVVDFDKIFRVIEGFREDMGHMNANIIRLTERTDKVEQKLDKIEERIGNVEQRIDAVEQRLGRIEQKVAV